MKDFPFRSPSPDEAQQVLDLMIRCDLQDFGEPDSDLNDVLFEWENIALDRDAWLVHTPQGELVGYAAVTPWIGHDLRFHFYVDPVYQATGLLEALILQCERRGREIAQDNKSDVPVKAVTYTSHTNQRQTDLLQHSGYRVMKYIFNMQADLTAEIQAPAWPPGITVRSIQPEKDERPVYDLIQETFDRPGRTRPTFEEWKDFMIRPETFIPEIWSLAEADGGLVGACLCFEYKDTGLGWVRQLGVRAEWRRKGLGGSLLRHAFAEFKRRGFAKAGLAVESDNPNAVSFYEGAGMKQNRWLDEYHQDINAIQEKYGR